jgi:NAD(P)-dependent dehydrogenase (short-subunit alcohol dehydrogenase family)
VVIHNVGHMVFGPAEAFTPEQLAELYDINVLSTQRVNRAACLSCANSGRGWWSGCRAAARPAERHLTWPRRGQGRNGCSGRRLLAGIGAVGHRDLDHRSGCLHGRDESFRACGVTRRRCSGRGV